MGFKLLVDGPIWMFLRFQMNARRFYYNKQLNKKCEYRSFQRIPVEDSENLLKMWSKISNRKIVENLWKGFCNKFEFSAVKNW